MMPKDGISSGIFFAESKLSGTDLGEIDVVIGRQNASLAEVKAKMARLAAQRGANAISNFEYGQKKRSFLTLRVWDSEDWYGRGSAVHVGET